MGWQEEYRRKVVSAEEAVGIVESGDRVVVPLSNQPRQLAKALSERRRELRDVSLSISAPDVDLSGFLSSEEGDFQVEFENFIGPNARPFHDAGQAPYLPLPFSLSHKATDERPSESKPIDVVMTTIGSPDRRGLVSFGPHLWFKRTYTMRARKAIAEVDPSLIRPHGDCFLPISAFDHFVEITPAAATREDLLQAVSGFPEEKRSAFEEIIRQVSPARLAPFAHRLDVIAPSILRVRFALDDPPPEARTIGEHVKRLIPDGATIQIGVGTPSTYLPRLGVFDDKLDLGLHTELVVPHVVRLVEAGVINGSRKNIHRDKAVAVAWSGADEHELAFIDDNPMFELYGPEYALNPAVIARNDRQISMNNALSVDLTGQVNSESVFGPRMINGIGGQPDTHLGALYSRGGRAITLLYSTALDGAVSRIVPMMEAGSLITVPRFFADTIVTEYGVACLLGKNHWERAEALIAIAHPDFRGELRKSLARG